jgi:hypothetical protein
MPEPPQVRLAIFYGEAYWISWQRLPANRHLKTVASRESVAAPPSTILLFIAGRVA